MGWPYLVELDGAVARLQQMVTADTASLQDLRFDDVADDHFTLCKGLG